MKHPKGMKNLLGLLIASIGIAASLPTDAAVLMFDFGSVAPTGDETNSPYHTVNGAFVDTTWNQIPSGGGFGNVLGSFQNSDGTAATGVTLTRGTGSTSNIDWQGSIGNTSVGGGTGILTEPSVGRDGIYGAAGSSTTAAGVKIQGLTLGVTYDVYVVGWLTTATDPRTLYIGLTTNGQTGGNRNMNPSGFASASVTNDTSLNVGSWVQGANYVKFTITPTVDLPAIAIVSGAGTDTRAYFNAIQIVPVPEPGTGAMLAASIAGLLLVIRRRNEAHGSR